MAESIENLEIKNSVVYSNKSAQKRIPLKDLTEYVYFCPEAGNRPPDAS